MLTTPEARPASWGSTSPIAASSTGLKAMPAPMPSSTIEGSTSVTKLPSTGASANRPSDAAASARPTVSGARIPNFITRRSDSFSEQNIMTRLVGTNARPTSRAE